MKVNEDLKFAYIIPLIVATALFMEFMDITIINTSIPSIARDFQINPILLKFSLASYYISLAIFTPISGWVTDKFGTRKVFLLSIILFLFASLLCGLSDSTNQLTSYRFLQGMGGAFMVSVARIILLKSFPAEQLLKVQSITYTPALVGTAVGPFVGGIITSYLSWHWIFFINLPIGFIIILLALKHIQDYKADIQKRFDVLGFILAGSTLFLITFFIEMLNHYDIVAKEIVYSAGIIGFSLSICLIFYCLYIKNAIFDFSLFKIKTFRTGFSVYFATCAINAGIGFMLPLMFQECFHYTPPESGLLILPIAFGVVLARSIASKIINKLGFKKCILIHLLLFMLSLIALAQIRQDTPLGFIIGCEFIFGATMIVINSSVGALNYVDMPKDKISVATSMDMTSRQFSSSFGIGVSAFIIGILANYLHLNIYDASAKIFHYTFYLLCLFILFALLNALKLNNNSGAHVLKRKI